jgi:hypothetical protein
MEFGYEEVMSSKSIIITIDCAESLIQADLLQLWTFSLLHKVTEQSAAKRNNEAWRTNSH